MPHIQAGMTAYKKATAATTVEVAHGTILPVDGFETVEVDLDQPDTKTKPVFTHLEGICVPMAFTAESPPAQGQ